MTTSDPSGRVTRQSMTPRTIDGRARDRPSRTAPRTPRVPLASAAVSVCVSRNAACTSPPPRAHERRRRRPSPRARLRGADARSRSRRSRGCRSSTLCCRARLEQAVHQPTGETRVESPFRSAPRRSRRRCAGAATRGHRTTRPSPTGGAPRVSLWRRPRRPRRLPAAVDGLHASSIGCPATVPVWSTDGRATTNSWIARSPRPRQALAVRRRQGRAEQRHQRRRQHAAEAARRRREPTVLQQRREIQASRARVSAT